MKTKILIALFSAALLIAGLVRGQERIAPGAERGKSEKFREGRPLPVGMERESFLTEEQKEAAKAIRMKNLKELKPLKDNLRELEAHHITLTTATKADMAAVYASIDKIGEVKTKIAKILAKEHQEIRALLTEEQLLKFDRMRPGMRSEMRPGMNPGMHKQFRNRVQGQPGEAGVIKHRKTE